MGYDRLHVGYGRSHVGYGGLHVGYGRSVWSLPKMAHGGLAQHMYTCFAHMIFDLSHAARSNLTQLPSLLEMYSVSLAEGNVHDMETQQQGAVL